MRVSSDVDTEEEPVNQRKRKLEEALVVKQTMETWPAGSIVEAEWFELNYRDVVHVVKIGASPPERQEDGSLLYHTHMLAFANHECDTTHAHHLHAPRGAEPNRHWAVGEAVHFRCFNRRVRKRAVDGYQEEEGVWVKGVVASTGDPRTDMIEIRHIDWDKRDANHYTATRHVHRRHVRSAW